MNETYRQPEMPEGVEEGVLRGIYRFRKNDAGERAQVHLMGSGAILNQALEAQAKLRDDFGVASDVWSVTSYKELYREAHETARWNRLHPDEEGRLTFLEKSFFDADAGEDAVYVAATDYLKALPSTVAPWIPGKFSILGTDGFGRSDTREMLRDFFEVDAVHITFAALTALEDGGKIEEGSVKDAAERYEIDPEKPNPAIS